MSKQVELDILYEKYKEQFKNEEVVLGTGNIDAKILMVGEAPGKDEVRLLKPFIGMAGKNLDEFISMASIERESLYITNAIKYRLAKINEKTNRKINRPASKEEVFNNRIFLIEEIKIVNPNIIVTLGNVPLKSIFKDWNVNIGNYHGILTSIILEGHIYKLFPLYHPASIIYNRSLKDIYQYDVCKLKEIIKNSYN